MKTIIFDIDGTIANLDHRLHWVKTKPKNWGAFFAHMSADTPIEHNVRMMKNFFADGYKIILCSGRSTEHRNTTMDWLDTHGITPFVEDLFMRPEQDRRSDEIVKSELLDQIYLLDYYVEAVVEDRPRVIRMWRERGLFVIDVGNGVEF